MSAESERSEAESAFLQFLDQRQGPGGADFEAFRAARPALADELTKLHASWAEIEPLLRSVFDNERADFSLHRLLSGDALKQGVDGGAASLRVDVEARPELASEVVRQLASLAAPNRRYAPAGHDVRGGMGQVSQVRDEALRRVLARKVLDESADARARLTGTELAASNARLSRFLAEALVTAQLDHPGIVPVHDAGLDEEGRPFFTMKLVRGRDFDQVIRLVHAGAEDWTLNRALGALQRVAEAVAYAHSKGVIHRDIKPGNIRVGRYGETYLMDWGLARLLDRGQVEVPGAPTPTETEAESRADAADAGHWLLTQDWSIAGTPVYMSPEQASGAVERVDERSDIYALGAILYHLLGNRVPYVEPGESPIALVVIGRARAGPPRPLRELVPGAPPTLVEIAERAMARRIEDRFATAGEFAAAIEDYLEDISEAREEARRQSRRAKRINAFLIEMLTAGDPAHAQGENVTVRDVLDRAARRIDAALPGEPLDEAELRTTIGNLYKQLGRYELAEPHLRRATALYRQVCGAEHRDALSADTDLAVLLRNQGRLDAAETLLRETLATQQRALPKDDEDTLRTVEVLAGVLRHAGAALDESEALYRRAWEGRRATLGEHDPSTLSALNNLALMLRDRDRCDEALPLQRTAVEGLMRVHGGRHPATLVAANDLAGLLLNTGARADAEALYRTTLEQQRQVIGERHPDTLATANNLALMLRRSGRLDEAGELLQAAHAMQLEQFGADHPATLRYAHNLGLVRLDQGQLDVARELLAGCTIRALAVLGPSHRMLARFRSNHGRVLLAFGERAAAAREFEAALDVLRTQLGDEHAWTREAREQLAACRTAPPD